MVDTLAVTCNDLDDLLPVEGSFLMIARGAPRKHMLGNASIELPSGTQSIQRAVGVLRILATSCETGLGLTQISSQAELTRPTTLSVGR
jgi:hypothetical protein